MSRPVRALVAALLLLAPLLATTSSSAAPERTSYDVLGDGRARLDLDDFVACAGATTTTLVSGGQLTALDADTDLVLLSIGGNDTRWSDAVVACLYGSDLACTGASAAVRARIATALPGQLDTVYGKIAAAAPNARVIVTGYPRLFSPEYGDYLGASAAEQQVLNEGADQLNAAIRAATERHGFELVDVTKRFLGHGVNSTDPWVLGPTDPGAFHPTRDGYEAYAAAVTSSIKPGRHR